MEKHRCKKIVLFFTCKLSKFVFVLFTDCVKSFNIILIIIKSTGNKRINNTASKSNIFVHLAAISDIPVVRK
jgi:hypothetical protein